ncbi:hypothetical protein JVT61DRAFT_1314 [Boletus reticuloceps]|uniref:Uncharacterized protein n=1 Tax=Boletus reticuloceps TaxID=495285 RepID=A0A8I3ABG2_9AGAM|nr:hypothetical protein JVT61DRAFT_1314 [Boletus reticuloceps]
MQRAASRTQREGTEKVASQGPQMPVKLWETSMKAKQDNGQAEHRSSVDNVTEGKKSVKTKMALREAIDVAQTQQVAETVGKEHQSTRGVNCDKLMISSTKNALAGRIKNWAALVEKATPSSEKPLHANPKPLQPASMVSSITGSKSKTLMVSDIAGPPPTETISSAGQTEYTMVDDNTPPTDKLKDVPEEDLVGGFGDDLDNDEMERKPLCSTRNNQYVVHLKSSTSLTSTQCFSQSFAMITANVDRPEEDRNNFSIDAKTESQVPPCANNAHTLKRK